MTKTIFDVEVLRKGLKIFGDNKVERDKAISKALEKIAEYELTNDFTKIIVSADRKYINQDDVVLTEERIDSLLKNFGCRQTIFVSFSNEREKELATKFLTKLNVVVHESQKSENIKSFIIFDGDFKGMHKTLTDITYLSAGKGISIISSFHDVNSILNRDDEDFDFQESFLATLSSQIIFKTTSHHITNATGFNLSDIINLKDNEAYVRFTFIKTTIDPFLKLTRTSPSFVSKKETI